MNQLHRTEVLHMLANLKGGLLMLDMYDHPSVKKCSLSKDEIVVALKVLVAEGLVAAVYERLEGPLYALSKNGRELMEREGFAFDTERLVRTQELFRANCCRTPI